MNRITIGLVATTAISLLAMPAMAQVSVGSVYRDVEAHYSEIVDEQNDQVESNLFGAFDESATVGVSTYATMNSTVSPEGTLSADISARTPNFFDDLGATVHSSRAELLVQFTVTSPTAYTLDLLAVISESTFVPGSLLDFLLTSNSGTILDIGDQWPIDENAPEGYSGVLDIQTSGILQPGDYTLEVVARSLVESTGGGNYKGRPIDLDFTLTLPTPSAAALLAIPAVMTAGRRRR